MDAVTVTESQFVYKEVIMTSIIVFGPPGVGKSELCRLFKDHYGIPHINMWRILMDVEGTHVAINKGELVDEEVTRHYFIKNFSKLEHASGFVSEGFPSTLEQAKFFKDTLPIVWPKQKACYFIGLEAEFNVLIARLLKNGTGGTPDSLTVMSNRINLYRATKPDLDAFFKIKWINAERPAHEVFLEALDYINKTEAKWW